MDNVKIEVHIKVAHERNWSEANVLAEAQVTSKGSYAGSELAAETGARIAEALTLLRSRLMPAIAEQQAAEVRKAEQERERIAEAS